jgi:hypothetical protein
VYNGKTYSRTNVRVVAGTPLPYTWTVGKGALCFRIEKDLSVTENGNR